MSFRLDERDALLASGDWVPAEADLHIRLDLPEGRGRAFRLEVYVVDGGERMLVEVPGIQEREGTTRKWVHTVVDAEQARRGRWIWGGTFRNGDQVVIQWRDADSGVVAPHPVTLHVVDRFGGRLAFATPVSVVFPVTGEATLAASAGFSFRYYRVTNRPFWRSLDGIGFPAVGLAWARIGGEKSILYSIGFSMLEDQLHIYYGGYRNELGANNFWMLGLSLKTKDLMSAARKALP
ncbi:MAG: hypothetical protein R6W82_00385 [bacterium]